MQYDDDAYASESTFAHYNTYDYFKTLLAHRNMESPFLSIEIPSQFPKRN